MKKVTMKEIRFFGFRRMPIAVLADDEGNEVAFLSPFRNYKFQVSATFEGDRDIGSSKVIGLGNVWSANKSRGEGIGYQSNLTWFDTKKELLKGQAALALLDFERRHDYKVSLGHFGKVKLSNDEEVWVNDFLDYFIEEVAIYLG